MYIRAFAHTTHTYTYSFLCLLLLREFYSAHWLPPMKPWHKWDIVFVSRSWFSWRKGNRGAERWRPVMGKWSGSRCSLSMGKSMRKWAERPAQQGFSHHCLLWWGNSSGSHEAHTPDVVMPPTIPPAPVPATHTTPHTYTQYTCTTQTHTHIHSQWHPDW